MSDKKYPECWVFDQNRRVYRPPAPGEIWSKGGPIWREHWRKVEIIGETSRSWLTKCHRKVPKKGGPGVSFSQEEIDQYEWVHDNRWRIEEGVRSVRDYATLKAIADLIGYKAGDNGP